MCGWVGVDRRCGGATVRELLKEFPEMPATVVAERIGWDRSMTVLM
jgi:hypothetical protein